LSRAINHGDAEASLALLNNPAETTIAWHEVRADGSLIRELTRTIIDRYRKHLTIRDPVLAMDEFRRFKILCVLKIGPFGILAINRLAEHKTVYAINLYFPAKPWINGLEPLNPER